MTWIFLRWFASAFSITSIALAGLGMAAGALLFQPPPDRYYTRGFSFEYPVGWACQEAQQEVVCEPPTTVDDSILVISTKTADADDTLDAYRAHLSAPKSRLAPDGQVVMAQVVSVEDVTLGGQPWIDGTQRGSEVANYDTRYLATVIGATAILLTISCHREACVELAPTIERSAASLQVMGFATGLGPSARRSTSSIAQSTPD